MLSVVFGTSDREFIKKEEFLSPQVTLLLGDLWAQKREGKRNREPKYCSSVLMQHYRHWMENIIAVFQLTVIRSVIQGLLEKVRFLTFEKDQGLIKD